MGTQNLCTKLYNQAIRLRGGSGWQGGDYVSPVQSTVLALTEKRVKIEADDDGAIVIRYVPPQSLQCQE